MEKKHILGITGSIVLFIGVFTPIMSAPIVGSINFFQNGKTDGVIILALSVISLILTLTRLYRWLAIPGVVSLYLILYRFIMIQIYLPKLNSQQNEQILFNPSDFIQFQWGWAILIIGSCLLLASAVLELKGQFEMNKHTAHTKRSKSSRIAFILLLVLCVGILAAYVVQLQQYSDDTIDTEEQAAESVQAADTAAQQTESPDQTLEKNIESTEHLQDRRKKIMDEMVSGGIAERIENPAGEPFVYVMSAFYGLTFEEQASLMNVVWSYYITKDRNAKVVTIYDNDSGQQVGSYSQAGLKMTGE